MCRQFAWASSANPSQDIIIALEQHHDACRYHFLLRLNLRILLKYQWLNPCPPVYCDFVISLQIEGPLRIMFRTLTDQ